MHLAPRTLPVLLLLLPGAALAATAPTTPTFVLTWGNLGSAVAQFTSPAGVATDGLGNVYVADQQNHRIQKFDRLGNFITQWGSYGAGNGQLAYPAGVATDAAGNVYVADEFNQRIQKFTATGAYLTQWGSLGGGNGQFSYPYGVATDAAGNVYVADQSNHRIQKFSGAGTYLTQWGSLGSGNGQFNSPLGVATDAAGGVYVADYSNQRVQKFSGAGTYLTQWGSYGAGNGQLNYPMGVATDAAGNVYVADQSNHRIQKFSGAGAALSEPAAAFLLTWGSLGSGNGQFNNPFGVATDAAGNVYVADTYNRRIQKFTGTGTYLTQWGSLGSSNGQLDQPVGVATDAAGNVYVADQYNHRIQKFVTPPAVALVSDVRNDQGRQVNLRILRASGDSPGSGATVTGYEIYRRNDPLPGPMDASPARADVVAATGASPSIASPAGVQLAGWTYLMTAPAHGETEYNIVVPTLVDATAASLEYSTFMARAATPDPFSFYDSGTEYGFSVDNLSPPAPSPFAAAYLASATHLHWGVSAASDFATFRLYRGTSADFVPGSGNLVTATTDTGYVDAGPAGSYYKLSAVDLNGNEGPFALVGPGQTTDVPGGAPVAFALEGVRPNPATGGHLTVHFALPTAEPATLELIDVAGRRVAQRAVGSLGAGRHAVDLAAGRRLAPGLYLVRLTQGANVRVVRSAVLE